VIVARHHQVHPYLRGRPPHSTIGCGPARIRACGVVDLGEICDD
jgi:hypothetical protein